jgi:hypothetical protein
LVLDLWQLFIVFPCSDYLAASEGNLVDFEGEFKAKASGLKLYILPCEKIC